MNADDVHRKMQHPNDWSSSLDSFFTCFPPFFLLLEIMLIRPSSG